MVLFNIACNSSSIAVATGAHRPEVEGAPLPVTEPPPPAKIEVVPLRRNDMCLYLDGHYEPDGEVWRWRKGKWVLAPKNCYYAPPLTQYERIEGGTTLVFRKGAWLRRGSVARKCKAAKVCPAANTNLDEK